MSPRAFCVVSVLPRAGRRCVSSRASSCGACDIHEHVDRARARGRLVAAAVGLAAPGGGAAPGSCQATSTGHAGGLGSRWRPAPGDLGRRQAYASRMSYAGSPADKRGASMTAIRSSRKSASLAGGETAPRSSAGRERFEPLRRDSVTRTPGPLGDRKKSGLTRRPCRATRRRTTRCCGWIASVRLSACRGRGVEPIGAAFRGRSLGSLRG